MNLKRLFEGSDDGFKLSSGDYKRPRLFPNIFRGATGERDLEKLLRSLEPKMRTWVHDEVNNAFKKLSAPNNQVGHPGCRTWQLRFQSNISHTLFTGSRVVAEDKTHVKVILYDSVTQEIISGPPSSIKVGIVVLDSEFNPDDWAEQQFDRNTVQNREGKKPLIIGELTVQLHNGVGHIGDISFTDNSRWKRNGRFRLGVKALNTSDRGRIREGISNAFKVKDHRGESYQKHYPPLLDDQVWRLEKIAKDGPSHQKLAEFGIHTVRDFLRMYYRNPLSLQNLLPNTSNRIWETIISHAETCTLDGKLYIYSSVQGTGLLFNSVDKIVKATFDWKSCHSLDKLDPFHMRIVENLKQVAYENSNDWILLGDSPIIGCPVPMLLENPGEDNFNNPNLGHSHSKGYEEKQANVGFPIVSFSQGHKCKEPDTTSFEIGESSHQQIQGFNPALSNNFGMRSFPTGFYLGNPLCTSEDNFMEPQMLTDDLPVDDNFQFLSSA